MPPGDWTHWRSATHRSRTARFQAIAKAEACVECGAAGVGAPMLCLHTTLGQDGLTARLLIVRDGSQSAHLTALAFVRRESAPGAAQRERPRVRTLARGGVHEAAARQLDADAEAARGARIGGRCPGCGSLPGTITYADIKAPGKLHHGKSSASVLERSPVCAESQRDTVALKWVDGQLGETRFERRWEHVRRSRATRRRCTR
jgi:hypothetical protein